MLLEPELFVNRNNSLLILQCINFHESFKRLKCPLIVYAIKEGYGGFS
jgi:hypothetical protein